MSRGYSVEQWLAWIEEQRGSGLSVAAFCEWIGVSQNAFYVRRRQLFGPARIRARRVRQQHRPGHQRQREQEPQQHHEQREQSGELSPAGFVLLKPASGETVERDSAATGRPVMEMELPGGVVVRVNDPHIVRDVVSVIVEHGAVR